LSVSPRLVIFPTDNTYLLGTCPLGLVKKERPVCIATSWKAVIVPVRFFTLGYTIYNCVKHAPKLAAITISRNFKCQIKRISLIFSMKFRSHIENQVSDYRPMGASNFSSVPITGLNFSFISSYHMTNLGTFPVYSLTIWEWRLSLRPGRIWSDICRTILRVKSDKTLCPTTVVPKV
jgi:hypothetical protein